MSHAIDRKLDVGRMRRRLANTKTLVNHVSFQRGLLTAVYVKNNVSSDAGVARPWPPVVRHVTLTCSGLRHNTHLVAFFYPQLSQVQIRMVIWRVRFSMQCGHSCSEDRIREVESGLKTLHSPSVVLVPPLPPPLHPLQTTSPPFPASSHSSFYQNKQAM